MIYVLIQQQKVNSMMKQIVTNSGCSDEFHETVDSPSSLEFMIEREYGYYEYEAVSRDDYYKFFL